MTSTIRDDEPPLVVYDEGPVRRIRMNRPTVHNAQNVAMLAMLDAALDELRWRRDVRVVILEGEGKSFSSGHDLSEMSVNQTYRERSSTAEGRYWQELQLFFEPVRKFRELPIPTICKVQGHCMAAGLMFTAAADFVIASTDAVFSSPILSNLAVNDAESADFLLRVGPRKAKEVLWLGERLSAEQALQAQLVNWVVDLDVLEAKCDQVVQAILARPPEALALSKEVFSFIFGEAAGGNAALRYHYLAHQLSHHTREAQTRLVQRMDAHAARGSGAG